MNSTFLRHLCEHVCVCVCVRVCPSDSLSKECIDIETVMYLKIREALTEGRGVEQAVDAVHHIGTVRVVVVGDVREPGILVLNLREEVNQRVLNR